LLARLPSIENVAIALNLLRSLPEEIDEEDRVQLFVPDLESTLRPLVDMFFNDIGEQSRLILSEDHFIAHPSLEESLSRKLGMRPLGLHYAELQDPGTNMGQVTLTTVQNNLRNYTPQQFLLEYLANAADANATVFGVALNKFESSAAEHLRVLSVENMAYLHGSPSLVIYNNAVFSIEDFNAICHIGQGGKRGKSDTIGQFGLGALTIFHFSEVSSGMTILPNLIPCIRLPP